MALYCVISAVQYIETYTVYTVHAGIISHRRFKNQGSRAKTGTLQHSKWPAGNQQSLLDFWTFMFRVNATDSLTAGLLVLFLVKTPFLC